MRYGVANLVAISLTVWPYCLNSRAQWWAPVQASMPIRHGVSWAIRTGNCSRETFGLSNVALSFFLDAVNSEHVLGEIDTNCHNGHGLPLSGF